ncbi:SRPBCC family protein [Dyadobacter arcticus]|uniref:Uncharacterized protein YndB with AHSA1/START domain n=1 Tax=Dyadobacter arcticus TaxID=1078754 RepID=A0ABX0UNJ2_9BACT|nr:SRPBCC domain-containing protein [Dyadobacter arcticus]NIJ53030.1 uncharacterized protein YndB with AHSA1/START domain [Dyadobacter arcticus]
MNNQLVVKEEVLIEAPVSKVWEVLIAPKYIRQWDALPHDFDDYYLETGRTIEWSGITKMTVKVCEPHKSLVFSLYVSKWEQPPAAYNIGYTYNLSEEETGTRLSIEIGDFSVLPDGIEYYKSSEEFVDNALNKIKSLAENRV